MHACMHACIRTYMHTHIIMCVCVYVYIYIHMHACFVLEERVSGLVAFGV